MALSTHAAAAKMVRQELKKHGIAGRVTCSSYSGGTSLNVYVENLEPWVRKEMELYVGQFEYGHFDGMTDCYEYSNNRDDLPQVKFAFVECSYSDELRQKAYDYLLANWGGYEDHPEKVEDANNLRGSCDWVSSEVWQVLNGSWDKRCSSGCTKFWNKPRVRMAA
jgi:hypothetical protein